MHVLQHMPHASTRTSSQADKWSPSQTRSVVLSQAEPSKTRARTWGLLSFVCV
jgi:hypothetical protein